MFVAIIIAAALFFIIVLVFLITIEDNDGGKKRSRQIPALINDWRLKLSEASLYSYNVEKQIELFQSLINEMGSLLQSAEFPEEVRGDEMYQYYFSEAGGFNVRHIIPSEGKIFVNYVTKVPKDRLEPDINLFKDNFVSIVHLITSTCFSIAKLNASTSTLIRKIYTEASDANDICYLSIISTKDGQSVNFNNGGSVPSKWEEYKIAHGGEKMEEAIENSMKCEVETRYRKKDFPRNLNEFIGNPKATHQLRILIENEKKLGRAIPHILFYGRPGLGKTTLAQIIASEAGAKFSGFVGKQLSREVVESYLLSVTCGDIMFIDEIHSWNKDCAEIMYSVLQDGVYNQKCGDTTIEVSLPPITVIGATTNKSKLPKPLIDRFRYNITLLSYTESELLKIAYLYSQEYRKAYGVVLSKPAAILLVKISQNTPRILKNHFQQCIDIALSQSITQIYSRVVESMMQLNSIDENGLDYYQQQYLHYLRKARNPIGINALSSFLGCSEQDIILSIEPYLIEKGFVIRTPKGRIATELGKTM